MLWIKITPIFLFDITSDFFLCFFKMPQRGEDCSEQYHNRENLQTSDQHIKNQNNSAPPCIIADSDCAGIPELNSVIMNGRCNRCERSSEVYGGFRGNNEQRDCKDRNKRAEINRGL